MYFDIFHNPCLHFLEVLSFQLELKDAAFELCLSFHHIWYGLIDICQWFEGFLVLLDLQLILVCALYQPILFLLRLGHPTKDLREFPSFSLYFRFHLG